MTGIERMSHGEEPMLAVREAAQRFSFGGDAALMFERKRHIGEPWSDFDAPSNFEFRAAGIRVPGAEFGTIRCDHFQAVRTRADVEKSNSESYYAFYLLSGEISVEQGREVNFGKAGDLIVIDSARPVIVTHKDGVECRKIVFKMLKSEFPDAALESTIIPSQRLLNPLISCFDFLADNIYRACPERLAAVYNACKELFPIACKAGDSDSWENPSGNRLLGQLRKDIDLELGNPNLTPTLIAERFGISNRYLHYLFATTHSTFGSYVTLRRLECVSRDLMDDAWAKRDISSIAFRWGFQEPSTFYRVFKKHFGCTPLQFRSRFYPGRRK